MDFTRHFSEEDIERLRKEPLFKEHLLHDIKDEQDANKCVFPAIRQDRIDFYYRGGRLFSYNKKSGFSTHHKYASVLPWPKKNCYVTENDLKNIPKITSFTDRVGRYNSFLYDRIKENCALYAEDEAEGVSRLYNRFLPTKDERNYHIVVLDIEISFEKAQDCDSEIDDRRKRQDRIDILLFNTKTRELRFIEAKLFSNKELRAKSGKEPSIIKQIERYRKQIGMERQRERIVQQYQNHINALNTLFKINLPKPASLDSEPGLYVFNFDDDQKGGRLKKELETLDNYGIKFYAKGNPKDVKITSLWTGTRST